MTKTKHSLIMSVVALLLCVSMFIGSTFAWFTDSVTSSGNKIESGTLMVDLELYKDGQYVSITNNPQPIFEYSKWEPGYTDVKFLKVVNNGTLALKWVAQFVSENQLSILADVIDVFVLPSDTAPSMPADRDLTGYTHVGTVAEFVNTIEQTTNGVLYPAGSTEGPSEAYLAIALKMQETAGNDYQGLDLAGNFDIRIYAAQLNAESDSFDENYDELATYYGEGKVVIDPANPMTAYHIEIHDNNTPTNAKIGTLDVPATALAAGVTEVSATIIPSEYVGNFTVDTGLTKKVVEIGVTGLKENNDVPVKLELYVGEGYDGDTFTLYHYDTEIDFVYNPFSGYVIFETADFSPFTLLYDENSVYVPSDHETPDAPGELPVDMPRATVEELPGFVNNSDIEWQMYDIAGSAYNDEYPYLEAAYKFTAPDDGSTSPYKDWFCDFYVKLDRDLEADQIFLGGNYGDFGWIGFYNGGATLAANEEIPLLGSVVVYEWTYETIASLVGEFICGVGDVNDALSGATFTVMLRLTNPEDASEFYNVATINYTFN